MRPPEESPSGSELLAAGEYELAIDLFNRLLSDDQLNAEALYGRGYALWKSGEIRDGLTDIENCLLIVPEHARALEAKALILHALSMHKEAILTFEHLLTTDDGDIDSVLMEMGLSYAVQKQYSQSILCFEHLVTSQPSNTLAHGNIARCLACQGKYEEALTRCELVLHIDPTCHIAYYARGIAHAMRHNWAEARRDFTDYLRLARPSDGEDYTRARSFLQTIDLVESCTLQCAAKATPWNVEASPSHAGEAVDGTGFCIGDLVGVNWVVQGPARRQPSAPLLRVYNKRSGAAAVVQRIPESTIRRTRRHGGWEREVGAWQALARHPHIIVPFRLEKRYETYFLFSDPAGENAGPKRTLADWLRGESIDIARAIRWGIQICEALEFAERHGVPCHYNLHPEVIIIAEDGNARVTEFDFCNVLSSVPPPRRGSASMPFLAFPAPLALAPYVPHERFEVHPVRPGNDVYSMGVLLALLATGRHPLLPAGISFDEFGSIEMETWEQLHEQAPHIDCEESLKAVILSCIAQAGERRFGSFGELADALRSAYQRFTGSRYVSLPLLPETSDRLYNAMVTWDYLLAGQKAFDCVQAAMRLDPFSSAVLNDMGTLHDNTGRPTSALYYYRKTILLHGEYTPLAWNNIGTICQARRRHHEAIICFEQAIRIDPGYANAWCNKGHSHKSLGQTDEALACYDRAMQIDPHHLSAVHSSVQLLRSSGRQSEILPMFARLVERCPNYAPLRLVMAEELCHGEQWSEAIEMASSVLTADSSQYAAHMVLAYAYKKMDLRDGAISAIRAYHESASADEWRLVPEELRTLIEG